ncbi:MAG: hypothetical protein RBR32_01600 [Bacteroidales bacterium]|nr:hypothetical protein [Bacteroidales bacterium]
MSNLTVTLNSFIDIAFFEMLYQSEVSNEDERFRLVNIINFVTVMMEEICGRNLKARDYTYDSESNDYDQQYSIFDPPNGTVFWFPTYPVNSITTLIISDDTISAASDYDDNEGYFIYKESGKLVYEYGFDPGYYQNVKVAWNGGYNSSHRKYQELQNLQYLITKKIYDSDVESDSEMISEQLDNYKYIKADPNKLSKFLSISPFVFHNLMRFKRHSFA